MAVTAFLYGTPIKNQYDGTAVVDWNSDTIKVALTTSSYTPNQDTHDFFDDITNEVSGTGYTAGGATLGSATATYTGGSNTITLDAADTAWTTASFTARYAIIYKSTGTASTSPLIAYVDFGGDQTVSSGTFTIVWHASGIATVVVA